MNTDLDFFPKKNLSAHIDFTLSKQDNTYFMSIEDTTTIGIQERIQ